MDDERFVQHVADRLAGLPGVRAVALGGSRGSATHRPDSDWDVALYYRGGFDAGNLRGLGWPGEVVDPGAWGPLFDGGAWLQIDERPVDVHYRDLDVVEHQLAEARAGRFDWQPLTFHLAGMPGYMLLAELATGRVLRGELDVPEYPDALREQAPGRWWRFAALTLDYTRGNHARFGRVAETAGALAQASCQAAHAVCAARGTWVTNEKRLLESAGLRGVDEVLAEPGTGPDGLVAAVDRVRERCAAAVRAAGGVPDAR
ncbi:nucleotidyltransferase domain-containing protein [Saccharopolyspora montiporae]|uniref:nucleotidyltransferase domain-containing protein n=1 Tax=Saccharopolyspora montiporae TaxID=2781240 RepID=UPI00351C7C33